MQKSQKLSVFSNVNHGFCNRFDEPSKDIISFARQIHSFKVLNPATEGCEGLVGDAFVTSTSGLKIAVRTADCAPILMSDGKVIAAVHAGWKGAVTGVIETALLEMLAQGAQMDKIAAAVGPCIHVDSYSHSDLEKILSENLMQFLPDYKDAKHFNLPGYVMYRLKCAGIKNIDLIDVDTFQDSNYYSYRREPNNPGRQYSFIELK